jgi:hypothetical protein
VLLWQTKKKNQEKINLWLAQSPFVKIVGKRLSKYGQIKKNVSQSLKHAHHVDQKE